TRQPITAAKDLLYRIIDGNQHPVITKSSPKPSLFAPGVPVFENSGDNYTVIVSLDDYEQAGFFPITISERVVATVDLMLLPKNARFNFDNAAWDILRDTQPSILALLSSGAAPNF